jgi:hypothetical protein
MTILAAHATWIKEHAVPGSDGWTCKKTGADILCDQVGRSLHDGLFPLSGSGRVINVGHLHCPGCQPDWQAPRYGEPVKPEELMEDNG